MSTTPSNGAVREGRRHDRVAFTTSRRLEYFSVKELQVQIGFAPAAWPVALMKELADNGLDDSEAKGLPPAVNLEVGADYFLVEDEGSGIPPQIVEAALDFDTRTSTNSKYVSPTRGQLGNALKCILAAPAVTFPRRRRGVTIEARGVRHRIVIGQDEIAQEPKIEHGKEESGAVKPGTSVRVDWPNASRCQLCHDDCDFYQPSDLACAFALFNPHARISFGGEVLLDPVPVEKWNACEPTSPHWYDVRQLSNLIAGHLHRERTGAAKPMLVRDFVRNFAGLTGTATARDVLQRAGLSGLRLADLVRGEWIDVDAAAALLEAMKAAAREVQPKKLGVIGAENWFRAMRLLYRVEEPFRHSVKRGVAGGRPFVVEAACGLLPQRHRGGRVLRVGLNWSPALKVPLDEIYWALDEAEIPQSFAAFVGVHVVTPLVGFTDRGKAHATLPKEIRGAVEGAVEQATREITKLRKRQRREARQFSERERQRLLQKPAGLKVKAAVWKVMAEAHAHVTGGVPGAPAEARQMMYAARKRVLGLTDGKCWKNSSTFTQGYLPDFVEAHPELTAGWNIVYDARGHLTEPHTGRKVALGTLGVRGYVGSWTPAGVAPSPARPADVAAVRRLDDFVACSNGSTGPLNRYRFVLLVEKEGFADLLAHAQIAARFDVAVATTKGLSTCAARELVEHLSRRGVTVLVLHDFDPKGLEIVHTLRNPTRRYQFASEPLVKDIGFRLEDARKLGLEGEPFEYKKQKKDPRLHLREMGATEEELAFLVEEKQDGTELWVGKRVELNEATNDQLVQHIEAAFTLQGVKKVVADEQTLRDRYVEAARAAHVAHAVAEATAEATAEAERLFANLALDVPDNLGELVARGIEGTTLAWYEGLAALLRERLSSRPSSGCGSS
jgi:DNA topoisomerase VI subunit B